MKYTRKYHEPGTCYATWKVPNQESCTQHLLGVLDVWADKRPFVHTHKFSSFHKVGQQYRLYKEMWL